MQRMLFDAGPPTVALPLPARRTDPETSVEAAETITADGTRAAQRQAVLRAVIRFGGRTSRELSVLSGLDRHMVARRLPELEQAGLVMRGAPRVCRESTKGLRATTWHATGRAMEALK